MRAITAGKKLVYKPSVRVVHSHNRPAAYHMRRSYISWRTVPKLLHAAAPDTGMRCDAEFLSILGTLCGVVQGMLMLGAATWPGAGVNAISGYNVARKLLAPPRRRGEDAALALSALRATASPLRRSVRSRRR